MGSVGEGTSVAIVGGAALAFVVLFPISAATWSTENAGTARRELALVRGEASSTEIYVIREDGSGLRRLTTNQASDFSPIWAPDGKRLLFVSNRDGDDELYVMDPSGKNVRRLTRNRGMDLTPQWSPEGESIAFASDRGRPGEPEIWIMRADGRGARRLVATPNHPWQDAQYSPTWSPDGRRVVFTMTQTEGNPELYVVGVHGRGLERLTRTRGSLDVFGDDTMPDWSTDGKTVVFVSNREQRTSDLWTMTPEGLRQKPLARRPRSDDWNPRVSPGGDTIAFTEHVLPNGPAWVALMRRDGTFLRRLTRGTEPDWRPSG
jgi:TolB protein